MQIDLALQILPDMISVETFLCKIDTAKNHNPFQKRSIKANDIPFDIMKPVDFR